MTSERVTVKDHLAFYLEHGISPVHQDITDLRKHLDRRGSLYRRLGMPAMSFRGRTVLEVGPGSGHNSLYVASCLPDALDLVEANPVGAREVEALYAGFEVAHIRPRIIRERLEDFAPAREYDVVIAEAWIGSTPNEQALMRKLAGFVRPGGVLIVTMTSPLGTFANLLRRILGLSLTRDATTLDERTAILLRAFSPHLSTLAAMSRPHEDWVQDSLINTGYLTSCLTPEPFFQSLAPHFTIYESFPRFATDWRWYKELYGENRRFNELFLEAYWRECHNLYDFTRVLPPEPPDRNRALEAECSAMVDAVIAAEGAGREPARGEITAMARSIRARLAGVCPAWAESIDEFLAVYGADRVTPEAVATMRVFGPVFGRELVYVSMLREP